MLINWNIIDAIKLWLNQLKYSSIVINKYLTVILLKWNTICPSTNSSILNLMYLDVSYATDSLKVVFIA